MNTPHSPACDLEFTKAMNPSNAKTRPHDLMICYRCGVLSQYDSQMVLRRMTPADIQKLPKSVKQMLVAAMATINESKSRN